MCKLHSPITIQLYFSVRIGSTGLSFQKFKVAPNLFPSPLDFIVILLVLGTVSFLSFSCKIMDFGCIICHELFGSTSGPHVVTPCGHAFHNSCITPWIRDTRTCPSCRSFLRTGDLIRVYFANVSNSNLVDSLFAAESKVSSLQCTLNDLSKENRQLGAKLKMTENNKNQKIRYECVLVNSHPPVNNLICNRNIPTYF